MDCFLEKRLDGNIVSLRNTVLEDCEELVKVYSDLDSVPFFNSDNCHGDIFYYKTKEKMEEAIKFWLFSFQNRYFVRYTVLFNEKIIGTVEMFQADDEINFKKYGILRIDLRSDFEKYDIIKDILQISNTFYDSFDVDIIFTKTFPFANERLKALIDTSYLPYDGLMKGKYDDYYFRDKKPLSIKE